MESGISPALPRIGHDSLGRVGDAIEADADDVRSRFANPEELLIIEECGHDQG